MQPYADAYILMDCTFHFGASAGLMLRSDVATFYNELYHQGVAHQLFHKTPIPNTAMGLTFSAFMEKNLLKSFGAPLPLFVAAQLKSNSGAIPNEPLLWDFTPFDVSVQKGDNIHVSYPTALFGTEQLQDASQPCVTNFDQIATVFG